eukprot:gene8642-8454_t
MKAVLCKAFGPAETLVLEDVESPAIKKNEILLDVHAAGVNFPDTLIIEGKYQFKPPFPFSPGGEAAGVVSEVGEKVSHLKVGDRVMALTGWGSFAEQVAVPGYNVLPIPPSMDFNTAAAFSMTYGTSMHALKQRGHLAAGETLLVLGASGGVGLAAVEIGKAMGARVIAAASSADKLAVAKAAGADELINYSESNLKDEIKRLTDGNGADVIYDPVGGDLFDQAIRAIAWNGRLLVVGFASGRIPDLPVNLALLKGAAVVGVFWGSFAQRQPQDNAANFQQLFGWYAEGKLKPLVSQVYPLDNAAQAINDLGQRKAVGKVVVQAPLPEEKIDSTYRRLRWQIFAGIFFGYAGYYLLRKNFSLAMPYLIDEGYTRGQLGLAMSAIAIAYGLSKFLMGLVSDRSNPRYFLPFGLLVSAGVMFIFGFAPWATSSVTMMFILLFINGWAQGMGWPPSGRTMVHWWSQKERGGVVSVWNVAHNVGGGLIGPLFLLGM